MMQTRRDRSRKRYQTVLPSSIAIVDDEALALRSTDVKNTVQLNNSHNLLRAEKFGKTLFTANTRPSHEQDVFQLAADEEQAARLTDALLPYERLVPTHDFARILAAELGLFNEDGQTTRGQNSSETDRPQTDSSKSSAPDHQPSKVNGSVDSTFRRSTGSPPTSDSSSRSPISPRKERVIPLQSRSDLKIRSRPRSRSRKVLSVINEPDPSLNGDASPDKSTSGPSDKLESEVGISTCREGFANSPRLQGPKQGRRNLEELRRLIPSPLPQRQPESPAIIEKSSSPGSRPPTSEAPEFECVEGVTLDTQPVDAKEKFSGLSLPEIEARDIRDIED